MAALDVRAAVPFFFPAGPASSLAPVSADRFNRPAKGDWARSRRAEFIDDRRDDAVSTGSTTAAIRPPASVAANPPVVDTAGLSFPAGPTTAEAGATGPAAGSATTPVPLDRPPIGPAKRVVSTAGAEAAAPAAPGSATTPKPWDRPPIGPAERVVSTAGAGATAPAAPGPATTPEPWDWPPIGPAKRVVSTAGAEAAAPAAPGPATTPKPWDRPPIGRALPVVPSELIRCGPPAGPAGRASARSAAARSTPTPWR